MQFYVCFGRRALAASELPIAFAKPTIAMALFRAALSLVGASAYRDSFVSSLVTDTATCDWGREGGLTPSTIRDDNSGWCLYHNVDPKVSPPHMGYCINVNTHQLWFFNFQNPASGFLSNMAPATLHYSLSSLLDLGVHYSLDELDYMRPVYEAKKPALDHALEAALAAKRPVDEQVKALKESLEATPSSATEEELKAAKKSLRPLEDEVNKAKDEIAKFEWPPKMSAMNRHVRVLDKQFGQVQVASVEHLFELAKAYLTGDTATFDATLEHMSSADPKASKKRARKLPVPFFALKRFWFPKAESFIAPAVLEKMGNVEYKPKFEKLCSCGIQTIEEVDYYDGRGTWGIAAERNWLGMLAPDFLEGRLASHQTYLTQERKLSKILTLILKATHENSCTVPASLDWARDLVGGLNPSAVGPDVPFKEATRHWKPSEVEREGPMAKLDEKQAKVGAYWDGSHEKLAAVRNSHSSPALRQSAAEVMQACHPLTTELRRWEKLAQVTEKGEINKDVQASMASSRQLCQAKVRPKPVWAGGLVNFPKYMLINNCHLKQMDLQRYADQCEQESQGLSPKRASDVSEASPLGEGSVRFQEPSWGAPMLRNKDAGLAWAGSAMPSGRACRTSASLRMG
ncbi:unnamed protein product [Effrenium voratum]|nr:unnamed protein product [Effrenium voratum]